MRAMSGETPSRWLRLGLTAGAASIGAVSLSLLLGGSAASAAEDHDPGRLGGLVQQLGSSVGGVVETVTDPLDAAVGGLGAVLAPVEQLVQPITSPVVDQLAPVVQPVVQAPPVAVETVRDLVAPVTGTLAPVLQPLSPIVAPVDHVVRGAVGEVIAPVVTPIVGTVDGALGAVPVVDELLGEQPVAGIVDPVLDLDPGELLPTPAPGTEPSPAPVPVPEVEGEPATPVVVAPVVVASATPATSATGGTTPALQADERGIEAALRALEAAPASAAATTADDPMVAVPRPGGRDVAPLSPALDGIVPSGATGSAGAHASPSAIIQDHLLPALAVGQVSALEHDRAPSSLAEEHTASPD